MLKEFRVLNIQESRMGMTNQNVALIELSEVIYTEFPHVLETPLYTFKPTGLIFVFELNSILTKNLINAAQSEQIIKLDLTEFNSKNEFKNGKIQTVYYHNKVQLIDSNPYSKEESYLVKLGWFNKLDFYFQHYIKGIINIKSREDLEKVADFYNCKFLLSKQFETVKSNYSWVFYKVTSIIFENQDVKIIEDTYSFVFKVNPDETMSDEIIISPDEYNTIDKEFKRKEGNSFFIPILERKNT